MAKSEQTPEEVEAEESAAERRKVMEGCRAERQKAKESMLARNSKRIDELKSNGSLRDGETLEQYDTRVAANAPD